MAKPVRIALIGDLMLGRGVNEEIHRAAPEALWGDTLPLLKSMDAVIANLECAITEHNTPWSRTYKRFHFRADPVAIKVLQTGNVRCVSLANNHILDFETEGLRDTLKYLDAAGIAHAGAGLNQAQAQRPAILKLANANIGFIAYTDNEPDFAAQGEKTAGSNFLEINAHPETISRLDADIAYLKSRDINFIILSLHWGGNWAQTPPPGFQTFARIAVTRGVNIVHGHSPHIFQAAELHEGGLILYSTGDFLDDYSINQELRNDWSFIFLVEFQGSRLRHAQAVPVRLRYAQTNLARGKEAEAICDRMRKLCEPFHLHPTPALGGLELCRSS